MITLTRVIDLVQKYPFDAAFIIIFMIVFIYLIGTGKAAAIQYAAIVAVNIAEEEWKKSKYGPIKKAQAILYLRRTFPIVTLVIPDKILDDLVQKAFDAVSLVWKKSKEALESKE